MLSNVRPKLCVAREFQSGLSGGGTAMLLLVYVPSRARHAV